MNPNGEAATEAFVADRADDLPGLALDLLDFDTSNPPGETRAVVAWLEGYFADLEIDTERITLDPAKPNLLAHVPGAGDRTLLLNGHLDTVPFDADRWRYDPLGERDGDRIYGRGATDMKGSVASMLLVARAFAETGTTPPVDVEFAFVSDEEVDGAAGFAAASDRLTDAADACVVGETTCERGRCSVALADKGRVWLRLRARGRGAHGSRPMFGENAIDRLYEAIVDLRETLRDVRCTHSPAVEAVVEESVAYYAPLLGEATARDLFGRPTVNLGMFSGGDAINTVPSEARAELDVRVSPGVDVRAIVDAARACLDGRESVSVVECTSTQGTFVSVDEPIVDATVAAAEEVVDDRVYRRSATGGSDARRLRDAGVPAVEFAFGTDTVHAVDEYTTLRALVDNARAYAALPYAFADAAGEREGATGARR